MMAFLRGLISRKDAPAGGALAASSSLPLIDGNNTVAFDPQLLDLLKAEHAALQGLFDAIGKLAANKAYADLELRFVQFRQLLESHHVQEDVRFYNFIENRIASTADISSSDNAAMIREMRRDMRQLARVVANFAKKYAAAGVSASNADDFVRDYDEAGSALATRIAREEDQLFGLYRHYGQ